MTRRQPLVLLLLSLSFGGWLSAQETAKLPDRLSDQDFWRLTVDLSEPNGTFRSDNLLSNELRYPDVLDALIARTKNGGVYMGVGPEQNFHYLAAIRPKMAFIVDIRRGNLQLHLMYKALFEMSADRAEFVSKLFTKKRPDGLGTKSTASDILNAYWDPGIKTGEEPVYRANLQAIDDWLVKKHGFPLSPEDLSGIEYVYYNFYWFGPSINYSSSSSGTSGTFAGRSPTNYADLMVSTDYSGQARSYLATEESFAFIKDLESRNLIVPVVGNFAGPKAVRAVGRYIREHGSTVAAYYLSNVEQYLQQDGIWQNFCANVATLPLTDLSTFIRSRSGMILGNMAEEVRGCAFPATAAGR
jgi:hypothetical protein